MTAVWRSWFWNIVLAGVCFVFALLATITAFPSPGMPYDAVDMAIFLPQTILFTVMFLRSFLLGVRADDNGVTARLLWRTVKVRWSEIVSISGSGGSGGAVGAADAPAITWQRDGRTRTTDLNVLGSYQYFRRGKPLGQRAAEDLNARLARWRKDNAQSRPVA